MVMPSLSSSGRPFSRDVKIWRPEHRQAPSLSSRIYLVGANPLMTRLEGTPALSSKRQKVIDDPGRSRAVYALLAGAEALTSGPAAAHCGC